MIMDNVSTSLRILTNHPGQDKSPTWKYYTSYVKINGNSYLETFRTALSMYLKHCKFDCIVLGGGRIDTFYAILQTLLPIKRKPCIMIDCLWYRSQSRLYRLIKIFLMKLINASVDRYVVWARREIDAYSTEFCLPKNKFVFIPYHTTLDGYPLEPKDDGYLFSGGNYDRDYLTLIEAVRGLQVSLLIASTRPEFFKNISLPDNVIVQGFSHVEYLKKMAGCKMNIVAMAPGLLHSGGQQTFLNSMFLGKPTIVTDPAGAKDYIDDGKDGLLVEPSNSEALRKAILSILENPNYSERMGLLAKQKVQDLSTENHFQKIVMLADELVKKRQINIE